MLGGLVDIFASSGLGAIVGVVGSFMTKMEERKLTALKFTHEIDMAAARAKEFVAESSHELAMADKQVERAQAEGEIARDVAEMGAFREGLKEQQMKYGIRWVDAIRGVMRPLITVYLLILATAVTIKIGSYIGGMESLDEAMMTALYSDTITQIMFLATVAITWWFGSRPSSQRKK